MDGLEENEGAQESAGTAFVYSKSNLIELAKKLNAVVYQENGQDVPLLKTKIRVVAIKEDALKLAFVEACETIPEDMEGFIPDDCGIMYNFLVAQETGENEPPAPETEKEPEKEKETPADGEGKDKKAEKEKNKDEKKDKKAPPAREKDSYGNVSGTMSATINEMVAKGSKKDDIVEKLMKDFDRTKEKAEKKLERQLKKLGARGHETTDEGGVIRFIKKK